MLTHIKDSKNYWTVVVNNKSYQFDPSNKQYEKLVECVKTGDETTFVNIIETGRAICSWSNGKFLVKDGVLTYDGENIHDTIADRILDMIEQDFDYKPMLNFVERLYKNVSMRSVVELYNFLQHKYLPITPDGCFIAYKGLTKYSGPESTDKMGRKLVSGDLVDKYTGKSYRNNVGDKNSMHRRNVDDDANRGCSEGLHVGSLEYATEYASGGDVVLCKIDPANVVSVPHDCNCQKVRVSEYEVVGIYNQEHKLEKAVESFSFENEFNFDEEDFEEDSEIDPYAGDGWSE